MAFSKRSVFGFSVVLLGALTGLGCDGGDSSNTGGSGSGGGSSSGGGTGSGTEGTQIFDGTGSWVDGAGNAGEFGIQGAFFVLEDSVENGSPVADDLEHTDFTPDTFGEDTAKPCISGTVAQVTSATGETCDPSGSDCAWDAQWGGGIGLNLNETGGEGSVQSAVDLTAAGIKGFSFVVSGDVGGAQVRFKVKDEANNAEDFCAPVRVGQSNTIMLEDLDHMCWGNMGMLAVDPTTAVQLQWQVVSSADSGYVVENFCIDELAVITE